MLDRKACKKMFVKNKGHCSSMMQEELRKGNLVLFKRKGFETRWATWSMSSETSACLYSLDLGKTWHKLEVEE